MAFIESIRVTAEGAHKDRMKRRWAVGEPGTGGERRETSGVVVGSG